jgi:hypothetical protein
MVGMKPKKISIDEVRKAREELVEMGLVQDSGRRQNGQIVWEITPLGRLLAMPEDSVKH